MKFQNYLFSILFLIPISCIFLVKDKFIGGGCKKKLPKQACISLKDQILIGEPFFNQFSNIDETIDIRLDSFLSYIDKYDTSSKLNFYFGYNETDKLYIIFNVYGSSVYKKINEVDGHLVDVNLNTFNSDTTAYSLKRNGFPNQTRYTHCLVSNFKSDLMGYDTTGYTKIRFHFIKLVNVPNYFSLKEEEMEENRGQLTTLTEYLKDIPPAPGECLCRDVNVMCPKNCN